MVTVAQDLTTSYENLRAQFTKFNDLFQEPEPQSKKNEPDPLIDKTIEDIYKIVKAETKRMMELTKIAAKMENKLQKKKYCCYSLCTISILNVISKVILIGGSALSLYQISDPQQAGITALGITAGVSVFELTGNILINKSTLDDSENRIQLASLNKQGVKHAKIFKKALKEFKKIIKFNQELKDQLQSSEKPKLDDHTVINFLQTKPEDLTNPTEIQPLQTRHTEDISISVESFDERVSTCLRNFEELPPELDLKEKIDENQNANAVTYYRKEVSYCRMISIFVEKLPKTDPLRVSLAGLDSSPELERIARDAERPVGTQYFRPTLERRQGWMAEEQAGGGEAADQVAHLPGPDQNLDMQLAAYKYSLAERFHLKHHMQFVETPQGWQLGRRDGRQRKISVIHSDSEAKT